MMELPKQRWLRLMRQVGFPESVSTYEKLTAKYAEKHRAYHNAQHILYCLKQLDAHYSSVKLAGEVELALWFHDAIYSPLSKRNEKRSALWLKAFLRQNQMNQSAIGRITSYILATEKHLPLSGDPDGWLLLDIDLSILGESEDVFFQYDQQIHQEYRWVPERMYWKKRLKLMRGFLERETLYFTPVFKASHEDQARQNLSVLVERIESQLQR